MNEMLTLAIAETIPSKNEFNIIALELSKQHILAIRLSKDQIRTPNGKIFWDIGHVTFVEDVILDSKHNGNLIYKCEKVKYSDTSVDDLKQILDRKANLGFEFFGNLSLNYRIVKVKKIHDIEYTIDATDNTLKIYLVIEIFGDIIDSQKKRILCKDYRWLNYWKWVINKGNFDEKKKKYIELYNSNVRNLYLILYRHIYDSGEKRHWIAGIHWI